MLHFDNQLKAVYSINKKKTMLSKFLINATNI